MAHGAIRVGIGGWTFPEWRGVFYPPGLPHARELEHAAGRVQAIEINATFYKTQGADCFRRWAAATPDDFTFTIKGSRFCTNRRILSEAGEGIERFLAQGLTELGDKLGPVIWQLAATKRFEPDDLAAFLTLLPASRDGVRLRHAIEVKHESFNDPAFFALAHAHDVAVVRLDPAPFPYVTTASFSYARLQAMREEEPAGYDADALDSWAAEARAAAATGDVFMFAINGAKIRAPAAAQALIARLQA
jgi:uncharacterized protein YecE (DUF72 family)